MLQPRVRARSSHRSESYGQIAGLDMGERIDEAGMQALDYYQ